MKIASIRSKFLFLRNAPRNFKGVKQFNVPYYFKGSKKNQRYSLFGSSVVRWLPYCSAFTHKSWYVADPSTYLNIFSHKAALVKASRKRPRVTGWKRRISFVRPLKYFIMWHKLWRPYFIRGRWVKKRYRCLLVLLTSKRFERLTLQRNVAIPNYTALHFWVHHYTLKSRFRVNCLPKLYNFCKSSSKDNHPLWSVDALFRTRTRFFKGFNFILFPKFKRVRKFLNWTNRLELKKLEYVKSLLCTYLVSTVLHVYRLTFDMRQRMAKKLVNYRDFKRFVFSPTRCRRSIFKIISKHRSSQRVQGLLRLNGFKKRKLLKIRRRYRRSRRRFYFRTLLKKRSNVSASFWRSRIFKSMRLVFALSVFKVYGVFAFRSKSLVSICFQKNVKLDTFRILGVFRNSFFRRFFDLKIFLKLFLIYDSFFILDIEKFINSVFFSSFSIYFNSLKCLNMRLSNKHRRTCSSSFFSRSVFFQQLLMLRKR